MHTHGDKAPPLLVCDVMLARVCMSTRVHADEQPLKICIKVKCFFAVVALLRERGAEGVKESRPRARALTPAAGSRRNRVQQGDRLSHAEQRSVSLTC